MLLECRGLGEKGRLLGSEKDRRRWMWWVSRTTSSGSWCRDSFLSCVRVGTIALGPGDRACHGLCGSWGGTRCLIP